MISIKIDGVCKDCPWCKVELFDAMGDVIARCKHESVCKYIDEEKARYKDTTDPKKTP